MMIFWTGDTLLHMFFLNIYMSMNDDLFPEAAVLVSLAPASRAGAAPCRVGDILGP